jgi:hypothetical protein
MKIAGNLRFCPSPLTAAEVSATLPFVIPSEAEGPAVRLSRPKTYRGNVFRQSVAQWRDLRFNLRFQRMLLLLIFWSFSRSQISPVDNQLCSCNP